MSEIDFFRQTSAKTFAIAGSVACAERRKSSACSACPGVFKQYALYTALNTCFKCFRGGPACHRPALWKTLLALFSLCWHYFSLLGASEPHFARLAAFVVALGRFWCGLGRLGLDFGGSGDGFGGPKALFFDVFSCTRACNAKHARCARNTIKTDTKRMSAIRRATQKTSKNRPDSLLNRALC